LLARALERSEQEKLTMGVYVSPQYMKKFKGFKPRRYFKYTRA
jgi:hypothetical protein